MLLWPAVDPLTGIIDSSVTLKPGTYLYTADAVDQLRGFEEDQKESIAGPYFDISVTATLRGSNAANILTLQKMIHHQWGLIVEDRNRVTRLIGNPDSGADFSQNYNSGTLSNSRKTEVSFKWQHPLTAPIYEADSFEIVLGATTITAGCIQFIKRFEVGATGAPMVQGDELYINALLANKKALVIIDGLAMPVDDFSGSIDWTTSNYVIVAVV